jgi:hypothetical protein
MNFISHWLLNGNLKNISKMNCYHYMYVNAKMKMENSFTSAKSGNSLEFLWCQRSCGIGERKVQVAGPSNVKFSFAQWQYHNQ